MFIYKVTHKVSKRVYVGQAIDVKKRWGEHKTKARAVLRGDKTIENKDIQKFHVALAKEGLENFVFEIIEPVKSRNLANEREAYWMGFYRASTEGYNGSPRVCGLEKHSEKTLQLLKSNWAKDHPPESIEKTAEANRGRIMTDEQKRKISEANKGNQNCLGTKQSQETINKRRIVQAKNYGPKLCSAPDCERTDGFKVKSETFYCQMHAARLRLHGSLEEPIRPSPPNKGVPMSEETKRKVSEGRKGKCMGEANPFYGKKHDPETMERIRQHSLGKEPPNKIKFTPEQEKEIAHDKRSMHVVAKEWGVSHRVISRLRKEHGISGRLDRRIFSKEEREKIALDPRILREVAKDWGVSRDTIRSVKKEHKQLLNHV